ncbi:plasma membrane calcium-transporting ATPase 4 [Pseudozyma hubeiensis SY62]|uniref:Plasma membrane calcium-transporting ATPase 4 n=1 Tax=Pseudozyma hubeiensis (strain SY62) TaxID=1305764 RepID=R9P7B4_PSEHS|nr:plasma membrane calcium-transporting ATPase 4 [Pseudozyma hubeiensis SY62]GAC97229.1 plasma membrane calcium-transporting ATPase 4 [Pseudozyma hubeiensis SY62]
MLLKPTKNRNRRVSSNSIPERARSLVSKGKNILSFNLPSPEASSRRRRSGASSTGSRSDQGDEARPSTTESNGASFFSAQTSCAQKEEQASKQEGPDPDSSDMYGSIRTPPPMFRPSAHLVTKVWSESHFDPNWISTFIDNSYLFPIDSPCKGRTYDEKDSAHGETRLSSPSIVAPTLIFPSEIHRVIPLAESKSSCPRLGTRSPQLRHSQASDAQPTAATT